MQKRLNAFAAVGVVQIANEVIALVVHLLAHGVGGCIVDELLDAGQHIGRACIEPGGQHQRFAECSACSSDPVHHTERMQPVGADALGAHEQFAGQGPGQGTRHAPTAAAIGRQRHGAVRHHKHGVASGDDEVACQRQ